MPAYCDSGTKEKKRACVYAQQLSNTFINDIEDKIVIASDRRECGKLLEKKGLFFFPIRRNKLQEFIKSKIKDIQERQG